MFRRGSAEEDDSDSLELVTPGIAWDDGPTSSAIPPTARAEHDGDHQPDQPPARRGPSRWWVAAAVTALVFAAFVFGGRDSQKSAAPPLASTPDTLSRIPPIGQPRSNQTISPAFTPSPTTATSGTSQDSLVPVIIVIDPPTVTETATTDTPTTVPATTVPPTTAPPTTVGVGPIYPNTSGLGLFVTDFGGSASFQSARIDLATGNVQQLDHSTNFGEANGLAGTGPDARIVSQGDLGGSNAAPSPDGTWWVADQDDRGHLTSLRKVRPHPGVGPEVLQTVTVAPALRAMYLSLGTAADNLPVLYGPDGRLYVLDPAGGTVHRMAGGPIRSLQHGFFAESVCDDGLHCSLALHGSQGAVATIPESPSQFICFSPDGRRALAMRTVLNFANSFSSSDPPPALVDLQLVDIPTGEVVVLDGVPSATRFSLQGVGSGSWCQWTPDSSTAIYTDGNELVRIDAQTHAVSTIALPASLVSNAMITVGIA